MRDVLKHGPDVTVVSPPALRDEVQQHLTEAMCNYEHPDSLTSPEDKATAANGRRKVDTRESGPPASGARYEDRLRH